MFADCLHGLTALGPDGMAALLGAMLLAGLAGGATHCAGMCGPFVFAQVAAETAGGGRLTRLAGAALLPYHGGRIIGYAALGAIAGGTTGLVSTVLSRELLALPLGLAALAMLVQAGQKLPMPAVLHVRLPQLRPPGLGLASRLLRAPPGAARSALLGLALSAMPCGLLHGALAAAMASGSALAGGLAMLAFVIGTVPGLIAVAFLGRFFGRRHGPALRLASGVALTVNAGLLAALALRGAGLV